VNDQSIIVAGGYGRAFEVRAGQYLRVAVVEGPQIGDLVAFNARDVTEYLHTAFSRVGWGHVYPRKGDVFVSNRYNPMLEIVRDDVGHHDVMKAICSPERLVQLFGAPGNRTCLTNLAEVLDAYGVRRWWMPMPINLFQHTTLSPEGNFEDRPTATRPGDGIVFRVRMDLVCGLSACPMNQGLATGASQLHPLEVDVLDAEEGA
jgi:hypothetical protein